MAGKRRGVAYCQNGACERNGELRAFSHLPDCYECDECGAPGRVERERGVRRCDTTVYDEVRIEFDFDPAQRIYRQVARVRDRRLLGDHDVYTLQSPLVRNRAQALRVASAVLRALNSHLEPGNQSRPMPARSELIDQGWPVLV